MKKATREEGMRRLLMLAAFLRTIPPQRFDYNVWVGDEWAGMPDLSCGTTACALGWATTMPEFRALGLCLKPGWGTPTIEGTGWHPTTSAMHLFGLNDDVEFGYLFVPALGESRARPEHVAEKIELFVRSGGILGKQD